MEEYLRDDNPFAGIEEYVSRDYKPTSGLDADIIESARRFEAPFSDLPIDLADQLSLMLGSPSLQFSMHYGSSEKEEDQVTIRNVDETNGEPALGLNNNIDGEHPPSGSEENRATTPQATATGMDQMTPSPGPSTHSMDDKHEMSGSEEDWQWLPVKAWAGRKVTVSDTKESDQLTSIDSTASLPIISLPTGLQNQIKYINPAASSTKESDKLTSIDSTTTLKINSLPIKMQNQINDTHPPASSTKESDQLTSVDSTTSDDVDASEPGTEADGSDSDETVTGEANTEQKPKKGKKTPLTEDDKLMIKDLVKQMNLDLNNLPDWLKDVKTHEGLDKLFDELIDEHDDPAGIAKEFEPVLGTVHRDKIHNGQRYQYVFTYPRTTGSTDLSIPFNKGPPSTKFAFEALKAAMTALEGDKGDERDAESIAEDMVKVMCGLSGEDKFAKPTTIAQLFSGEVGDYESDPRYTKIMKDIELKPIYHQFSTAFPTDPLLRKAVIPFSDVVLRQAFEQDKPALAAMLNYAAKMNVFHTDPEPVRREHDSFDRIASNHEHRNGTSTFIITKGDGKFTLPNGEVVPGGLVVGKIGINGSDGNLTFLVHPNNKHGHYIDIAFAVWIKWIFSVAAYKLIGKPTRLVTALVAQNNVAARKLFNRFEFKTTDTIQKACKLHHGHGDNGKCVITKLTLSITAEQEKAIAAYEAEKAAEDEAKKKKEKLEAKKQEKAAKLAAKAEARKDMLDSQKMATKWFAEM